MTVMRTDPGGDGRRNEREKWKMMEWWELRLVTVEVVCQALEELTWGVEGWLEGFSWLAPEQQDRGCVQRGQT